MTNNPQPAAQQSEIVAMDAYCEAWQQSFEAANPYHTVTMGPDDREHILAGLRAALQQAAPAESVVSCVIAMDEGAREPRIVSWNEFAIGTHQLYATAPAAPQAAITEQQRELLLDRLYNTHGLKGEVEEMADVIIDEVIAALASSTAPAEAMPRAIRVDRTEGGKLDANELEAFAKTHPEDYFLKGSGVLKMIAAIRSLESASRSVPAVAVEPMKSIKEFIGEVADDSMMNSETRKWAVRVLDLIAATQPPPAVPQEGA